METERFDVSDDLQVYRFTPADGLDRVDLMVADMVIEAHPEDALVVVGGIVRHLTPNHHLIPENSGDEHKWSLHNVQPLATSTGLYGFLGQDGSPQAYGLVIPSRAALFERPTHTTSATFNPLHGIRRAAEHYRGTMQGR